MTFEIPTPDEWKLQIFLIHNDRRQRRIVRAFDRIGRPGVLAVGAQAGADCFVVVECGSMVGGIHARRVVMAIDPLAVRTYEHPAPVAESLA